MQFRSLFITATDTDAGKTWVTASLLKSCLFQGEDTQALKPIASGLNAKGLNGDVAELLALQPGASLKDVNYVTYKQPLAPALAAQKENTPLDIKQLEKWLNRQQQQHKVSLIEGVGGLMVPLAKDEGGKPWLVSDWLGALDADVLLVAPLRLGCMNQILLSCEHLKKIRKPPKWLVLNDLDGTGGFVDTMLILQPILQHMFVSPPEVICLKKGGGVPNILF